MEATLDAALTKIFGGDVSTAEAPPAPIPASLLLLPGAGC